MSRIIQSWERLEFTLLFKVGQSYKVKVETSPDQVSFCRAKLIDSDTQHIYIQLKGSKGNILDLPEGSKIWFVDASASNKFNGLWSSRVSGQKSVKGAPCIVCKAPKYEKQSQRRQQTRLDYAQEMRLVGAEWRNLNATIFTRNISRLGMGFSVACQCAEFFQEGRIVSFVLEDREIKLEGKFKVVNSRFNWLMNCTEVGAEFCEQDIQAIEDLDRFLSGILSSPQRLKQELSESGSLARWMKAGKENTSLLRSSGDRQGEIADTEEEKEAPNDNSAE